MLDLKIYIVLFLVLISLFLEKKTLYAERKQD